jgi:IS30 family transposase
LTPNRLDIDQRLKHVCHSITFDNGGEFAGRQSIAKALNYKTYFAKPYHSWQRGLNENTIGLLR